MAVTRGYPGKLFKYFLLDFFLGADFVVGFLFVVFVVPAFGRKDF